MWFIFYCLISGETSPIKSVSEKTLFMHFTVSINCFMILQLENHENHIGWKWKEIMCLNSYSITWILQQVSNTLLRYDKNLLKNKQIILWKGNQKPSKWKISYKTTWPSMSFLNLSQNIVSMAFEITFNKRNWSIL